MPYDTSSMLQTQADINQLAFNDPFNPVNMNPGQWGVNPNLLTPSYTGIYRPQWQGDPGYGVYAGAYGRFWPEMNRGFNPLAPPPYGGMQSGMPPYFQSAGTYTSMVQRPMDRAMGFAQHWALPFAAQYMLQNTGWKIGSALMRRSLGAFGQGLLGVGEEGVMGGLVGAGAGLAGGLLGAWALPAMAVGAADQGFAHYLTQRRSAQNLLSDFGLTNFAGQGGNLVTGQGISRKEAASIARHLDVAGSKSWTFSGTDYTQMADQLIKNGSMDNVDFKHLKGKLDEAAASVQALMMLGAKSKEAAADILGNMKLSGASFSSAVSSYGKFQRAAAIGGTTVDYLMNTVGDQGSYMFSSAGLTPYIGANVSANAYAAYRNAYRQGLLSPTFVAQMGGLGGMTQSYTSGVLQMSQTPMMDMTGYMLSKGMGAGGNLLGNLSRFGSAATANPMQVLGEMGLGRNAYQSELSKHPGAELQQISDYVAGLHMPGLARKNKKYSAEQMYVILTQMVGMSPDSAQAVIANEYSRNSVQGAAGIVQGDKTAAINARMAFLQQAHQNYGILNPVAAAYYSASSGISSWVGNQVGKLTGSVAGTADQLEKWVEDKLYGLPTGSYEFFGKHSAGDFSPLLVSNKKYVLDHRNGLDGLSAVPRSASDVRNQAFNESRSAFISGDGAAYLQQIDQAMSSASPADQAQFKALFSAPYSKANEEKIRSFLSRVTPNRESGALDNLLKYYRDTKGSGILFDTKKQVTDGTRFTSLYSRFTPVDEDHPYKRALEGPAAYMMKFLDHHGFDGPMGLLNYVPGYESYMKKSFDKIINPKGSAVPNPMAASVLATRLRMSGELKSLDPNSPDAKAFLEAIGKPGLTGEAFRHAIRQFSDEAMKSGADVTNQQLYGLVHASMSGGQKALNAYAALMPGMSEDAAKANVGALHDFLMKHNVNMNSESDVMNAIYKGLDAKSLDPLLRKAMSGMTKGAGVGAVNLSGQSDAFAAAYMKNNMQMAQQQANDERVLAQLRKGIQTGALSYDDYYKTMVAQQEKKDYKVFADAVQVFAQSVLKNKPALEKALGTVRSDLHLSNNN